MKLTQKTKTILLVAVVIAAALAAWGLWRPSASGKLTFATTRVERGTIGSSITATGTIEPIT